MFRIILIEERGMSLTWEEINDERLKFGRSEKYYKVTQNNAFVPGLGNDHKFLPTVLSGRYKEFLDRIVNYDVQEDEVWINTYPRSGTTWTQEMVWLLMNDLNFEEAKKIPVRIRSPTIRQIISKTADVPVDNFDAGLIYDRDQELKKPYIIKNHLPAGFLPNKVWTIKPKMIYVARSLKDVAVSYYFLYKTFLQYTGTKEEFFGLFLEDLVEFSPHYQHIEEFWKLRDAENILFLTYEDMKTDLREMMQKTMKFLGKSLNEEQFEKLYEHLQFSSMQSNKAVTFEDIYDNFTEEERKSYGHLIKYKHIRQGEVNKYKEEMTPEFTEQFDKYIEKHYQSIAEIFKTK